MKAASAYSAYVDVEAKLTQKFLASRRRAWRGLLGLRFRGHRQAGRALSTSPNRSHCAVRRPRDSALRACSRSSSPRRPRTSSTAIPFEVGTFPATSDVAVTLGAQPLDAEKSRNYSLGTVLRFAGFEATIDAYRIDIRDRIVLSENLNTPQVAALITPFGATVARFFINGVETKTEGIDLVTRYLWRTEKAGRFEFVAAGNWNDTEVEKVPSTNVIDTICNGQPPGCAAPVLFARINTLSFEEGTPDSKVSLGVDWSIPLGAASVGVNLKGTRYGDVVEPGVPSTAEVNAGVPDARDIHIQPDWLVDFASTPNYWTTSSGSRWAWTTCSTSIRTACPSIESCRIRRAER